MSNRPHQGKCTCGKNYILKFTQSYDFDDLGKAHIVKGECTCGNTYTGLATEPPKRIINTGKSNYD